MNDFQPPHIKVTFTRSSQRDGQEGYSVEVDEGADELVDLDRVMTMALWLRKQAKAAIAGPPLAEPVRDGILGAMQQESASVSGAREEAEAGPRSASTGEPAAPPSERDIGPEVLTITSRSAAIDKAIENLEKAT